MDKKDLTQIKQVMESALGPLRRDLLLVKVKLTELEDRTSGVEKTNLKIEEKVDKGFKSAREQLKHVIDFFDKDYVYIKKSVRRIEANLDIPPFPNPR